MRQVIRWIEEYALAEKGDTDNPEIDKRVEALRELGRNVMDMNATQFQEAMTIAHFNQYFSDAVSRAFYKDYEYVVGEWQAYTYPDVTPDFRDVDRLRMTEPGTLRQRRSQGERRVTSISDSEINYGVDEYSNSFELSWRALVNDDMGKIRETPQRMARAAGRWLDQFVSALYDNATSQATAAGLGAPWAGTGRLTAQNLAIGVNAMMQRVDADGNQMNINKIHLVIPPILKIQAATVLRDLLSYGRATGNILDEFIGGVHVDPYITTAGANVPWYLFASPSEIPVVTVARLSGWPGPVVAMKAPDMSIISGTAPAAFTMGNFEHGTITWIVEDVIGGWDDASWVGVTDFRGWYYSSGTTP